MHSPGSESKRHDQNTEQRERTQEDTFKIRAYHRLRHVGSSDCPCRKSWAHSKPNRSSGLLLEWKGQDLRPLLVVATGPTAG